MLSITLVANFSLMGCMSGYYLNNLFPIKWWLSWSKLYTDNASGHKRCLAHAQPGYSPMTHCLFSYELSWIILVVAQFLSLVCVWRHHFLSFPMQNDLSNRKKLLLTILSEGARPMPGLSCTMWRKVFSIYCMMSSYCMYLILYHW